MSLEKKVMDLIKKNPGVSVERISDSLELPQEEITKSISKLEGEGKVLVEGDQIHPL